MRLYRAALMGVTLVFTLPATLVCAIAQNATSGNGAPQAGTEIKPEDTGVGTRGTKVAPSTNAAEDGNAVKPGATGIEPRGTKASESTPPSASTSGTTAQQ